MNLQQRYIFILLYNIWRWFGSSSNHENSLLIQDNFIRVPLHNHLQYRNFISQVTTKQAVQSTKLYDVISQSTACPNFHRHCCNNFQSYIERSCSMRDFRLPPRCTWDLRSSGMLCSMDLSFPMFRTQPIGHKVVPKRQELTTNLRCVTSPKREDSDHDLLSVSLNLSPAYVIYSTRKLWWGKENAYCNWEDAPDLQRSLGEWPTRFTMEINVMPAREAHTIVVRQL